MTTFTLNNSIAPIKEDFQNNIPHYLNRVEHILAQYLTNPEDHEPSELYAAMRYSVLEGGKRIRPLLVYATGALLSVNDTYLDAAAAAVELIHAYSLIHDDLPAMDDDDLRRNKPTVHKAFNEATAILSGDALQTIAFKILANTPCANDIHEMKQRLQAISLLAEAAGANGMVEGQMLDMAGEQQKLNQVQIEKMFQLKTGMLLRAAILLPVYGNKIVDPQAITQLDQFAYAIGLAFQIRDDILDVEGETAIIGKPQGSDHERDKSSYPSILGLEYAKKRADELYQEALANLDYFGQHADPLRFMADYIVRRNY